MKIILFLVAVISVVAGQEPSPCKPLLQFEAKVVQITGNSSMGLIHASMSYDASKERVRILEDFDSKATKDQYDVLYLGKEGVEYRQNLKTKQCTKSPITVPFQPFEVPAGAKFNREVIIGAEGLPGQNVFVSMWGGELKTPQGGTQTAKYRISFTKPSCEPVSDWFVSPTGYVLTKFYDISIGKNDPNAFIPPKECDH